MNDARELLPCPFCGEHMIERNGLLVHAEGTTKEGACILSGWGFPVKHSRWGTDEIARWNRRADLSVAEAARVLLAARDEAKKVPVGARGTPEQLALMKFKETALRALAKEPSHD